MARKKKTERQQARQFGLILPIILGLLSGLTYWRDHRTVALGLLTAVPVVILVAFGLPSLWIRFFRGWMKFALVLSWFMTRVILTVFFFVVLTPFGLVMRLFGKRPLDLGWRGQQSTYWIDKEPGEFTIERYEKQY